MPKVTVYVKAADARAIEAAENEDIASWVRGLVRWAIEKRTTDK